MARFTSIRGWLECEHNEVERLRQFVETSFSSNAALTPEQVVWYLKGWSFPQEPLNWTAYVFFGADVKSNVTDSLRETLMELAKLLPSADGYFWIDEEEGNGSYEWVLGNGSLVERKRSPKKLPGEP